MNKVLSIIAMAFAMFVGANAYAQSATTTATPAAAPAKQCAKGGATGCCKDKAATGTTAAGCSKSTATEAKCNSNGTSAMIQAGESQVLGAKISDKEPNVSAKKAKKALAQSKRNVAKAKVSKSKTADNATATPACTKGEGATGGKCCKDKAATAGTTNKVADQK